MADQVKKPVGIMETVLRDAHQSLIATRMPTEIMLPIVDKMDKVGYHSVECYFDALSQMSSEQLEEAEKQGYDVSVFKSAYSSYESSIDEIGVVTGMGELKQNTMDADMTEGTILAVVEGTNHNATVEVIYEKSALTSLTVNTVYTFGESMEKAALNTLLGMGTV